MRIAGIYSIIVARKMLFYNPLFFLPTVFACLLHKIFWFSDNFGGNPVASDCNQRLFVLYIGLIVWVARELPLRERKFFWGVNVVFLPKRRLGCNDGVLFLSGATSFAQE